ncbi:MAG TPA: acyl-CoA desaturase [Gaiellales bacterium]|jgi:linoleoyl-CoA desaturase|nr:acyl-CoA desaturase [Gaiellales bacterium]
MRFQGAGGFSRLLAERADVVLGDAPAVRRAYRVLWAKSALVILWTIASYLLLLEVTTTPAAVVAAATSLGLAMAGVGFCIMHDANHGAFARGLLMNRLAAHSLDLIGGSSYVWRAKHLAHHTYTNVADHDPDIDALPFARFEPSQKRHFWHRYQHVYMWLLYAVVTIRWQAVTDFTFVARGSVGRSRFMRPRRWNLAGLVAGKVFFLVWAVVIPLRLHSPAHVLIAFTIASAVASLALTITFQLSHCLEEAETLASDGGPRTPEWHVHQVLATANFAPRNRLIRWYVGGLNHQIEHHLFPRVPHTLHPQLADIVRRTAIECGLPYTSHPTAWAALRSHIRWLRQLGLPAAEQAG